MNKRVVVFPLGSGAGQFRTLWPAEAMGDVEVRWLAPKSIIRDNPFADLEGDLPDVVVTQVPVSVSMLAGVRWLKSRKVRVVLDFDDDTSAINPQAAHWTEQHPAYSELNNWQIEKMIAAEADLITVSTPKLQKKFGGVIIPNCVPRWYFDIKPKEKQWGVGWSGNIALRPGDLAETHGGLSQFPMRWIGAGQKFEIVPEEDREEFLLRKEEMTQKVTAEIGSKPVEISPWLDINGEYQTHVAGFKVGVVPLINNAFNNCKSALTGLTYAAVGVPFVATPTDPYLQFNAGLYASRNREWRAKVRRLLTDEYFWETERERNRKAARKFIIEDNLERWIGAWEGSGQAWATQRS